MTKNIVSVLALSLLILAVLAGCSPGASDTPAVPTSAPPPGTTSANTSAATAVTLPTVAGTSTGSTAVPATTAPAATTASGSDFPVPGQVYTFKVDPSQTQASYAVNEILFGNKRITTGTTNSVDGDFKLGLRDGKPFFDVNKLRVDLRTLKSDSGFRDRAIQSQWLESAKYPYAEFVAKDVQGFPADPAAGKEAHFQVSGDMTIREITKPVTFDVTATAEGETISGTGTTLLFMKDFGFDPPDIAGRFTVSDGVTVTVKGVAKLDASAE